MEIASVRIEIVADGLKSVVERTSEDSSDISNSLAFALESSRGMIKGGDIGCLRVLCEAAVHLATIMPRENDEYAIVETR